MFVVADSGTPYTAGYWSFSLQVKITCAAGAPYNGLNAFAMCRLEFFHGTTPVAQSNYGGFCLGTIYEEVDGGSGTISKWGNITLSQLIFFSVNVDTIQAHIVPTDSNTPFNLTCDFYVQGFKISQ